jgi:lactoylglutathione lyase
MKIEKHGIILNVEKFDECVAFYKDLFKLSEMFSKVEDTFRLTCLEFGDSYLMIETEGVANPSGKDVSQCPTKLRFNVLDIHNALECENDWGSIISIFDPDGNRISIRDDSGFKKQVQA